MMLFFRFLVFSGGLLLLCSFFVPFSYHNSPAGRFFWAVETMSVKGGNWTHCAWAFVIIYPYVWAFAAAVTIWCRKGKCYIIAFWSHMLCHLTGGGIVSVLGFNMLLNSDAGLSKTLQYSASFVPLVLITALFSGSRMVRVNRRIAFLSLTGFLLQIPLQILIAKAVFSDNGPCYGYLIAAGGALIGFSGSFCVFLIEGVHGGKLYSDSNV